MATRSLEVVSPAEMKASEIAGRVLLAAARKLRASIRAAEANPRHANWNVSRHLRETADLLCEMAGDLRTEREGWAS